jgi:hypothetical protein
MIFNFFSLCCVLQLTSNAQEYSRTSAGNDSCTRVLGCGHACGEFVALKMVGTKDEF